MSAGMARYTIVDEHRAGRKSLSEYVVKKRILTEYDIPTTDCELAITREDALHYAGKIGYPVVLKVVSDDILHKTEAGGVLLNIKTTEEAERGYDTIIANARKYKPDARIAGVLVQEMVASSGTIEVIIGTTKDPQFGNRIMFGYGGVLTEVMKDVSNRIALIDDEESFRQELREMIGETKIGKAPASGIRGKNYDVESLVDVLYKTAKLVEENPEIKEMDFNPVMLLPVDSDSDKPKVKVLDARIILDEKM